jgi:hypothetical protein
MLLPVLPGQVAPPMAVAMGKDAVLYLLNRQALGHSHTGDTTALQATRLAPTGQGLWGGPAYYTGPDGGVVYYQVDNDVLRAFAVSTGATPALTPVRQGTSTAAMGGSTPIVTSSGSTSGTGVVWLVKRNPLLLEAYDAERLGAPIWSASIGTWTAGRPYLTPMAANGRVYVGTAGSVMVFGLTP